MRGFAWKMLECCFVVIHNGSFHSDMTGEADRKGGSKKLLFSLIAERPQLMALCQLFNGLFYNGDLSISMRCLRHAKIGHKRGITK